MNKIFTGRLWTGLLLAAYFTLCFSGSALAISLPWFSEESAVERVLNKIWEAILNRDEKTLRQIYLTGLTVDSFLKHEADQIAQLGIQQFSCRVNNLTIDHQTKQWAWVDFNKDAKLKSGQTLTMKSWAVFKKEGGNWKLFTGAKTRKKAKEEQLRKSENLDMGRNMIRDLGELNMPRDKASTQNEGR